MRPARRVRVLLAATMGAVVLVGCGGGSSDAADGPTTTSPAALPSACKPAPVTIDLRAGGDHPAGSESFEVVDAVARRVPILPGEMAFDPAELSGLEKKAAVTPLAAYTVYLADFDLPVDLLEGASPSPVSPGAGQTLGALTVVPATDAGLAAGDVVVDGEPDLDARSTLKTLTLTVFADGDTTAQAYTDVTGQATVLAVDEATLCLDVDVTFEDQGEVVAAMKGVVSAPVVRSADAFFYT